MSLENIKLKDRRVYLMRSKVKIFAQIWSLPKTLVEGGYTPRETLQMNKSRAHKNFLSRDTIGTATPNNKCHKEKRSEKSKRQRIPQTLYLTPFPQDHLNPRGTT